MPHIKVSDKTQMRLSALRSLKTADSYDEIIDHLLDIATGVACTHQEKQIYMRVPLDKMGYIDMDSMMDMLDDINKGRESDDLLTVCAHCKQGTTYRF